MKNLLLCLSFLSLSFCSLGQLKPDGSSVNTSFFALDVNGNVWGMDSAINSGKHLIFMLFTAQDQIAWSYDSLQVLEHYHAAYGDAKVFMFDVNPATTDADVKGTGSYTKGNWLANKTFPVCNDSATAAAVMSRLMSGFSVQLPAIVAICPNRKMYEISQYDTVISSIRTTVISDCFNTGVGNSPQANFTCTLAPNPSADNANIKLEFLKTNTVSYTVANSVGQIVYSAAQRTYNAGINNIHLATSNWNDGLYFIHLNIDNETVTEKLIVQH